MSRNSSATCRTAVGADDQPGPGFAKCCGLLKGPRAANAVDDGRPRMDGVIGWSGICAVAGGAADGRPSLSRFPPMEPGYDPPPAGRGHGDVPGGRRAVSYTHLRAHE